MNAYMVSLAFSGSSGGGAGATRRHTHVASGPNGVRFTHRVSVRFTAGSLSVHAPSGEARCAPEAPGAQRARDKNMFKKRRF
jgi:hypothetical protein